MALLDARRDPPPAKVIAAAVEALSGGDIIGVPTDTVYGLAADPFHTGAVDRLFRVKGRPRAVELPVLVADIDQALSLATAVPESAILLMGKFWPGPLTLVLPRLQGLEADLGEDEATIGVRCPAHPVPRAICQEIGAIATTSANRHGEPPITRGDVLYEQLGAEVAVILDAGICDGTPSTVLDCTGEEPRVLRHGALSEATIREYLAEE
jgi:L-threonylcarbamoyladenylate synthase